MAQPTNTQFAVAVHLLTLLATSTEVLCSQTLALSPAANPVHVRRILGHLQAHGLVRSQRGAHGGWALAEAPEDIDLARIWHAVNGDDPVLGVHIPNPDCADGRRVQRNLLDLDRRALGVLLDELARTTIADVLADVVDVEPGRARRAQRPAPDWATSWTG